MSDLDLLNRLSKERSDAVEEARGLRIRLTQSERKLAKFSSQQETIERLRRELDDAKRAQKEAVQQLQATQRALDFKDQALSNESEAHGALKDTHKSLRGDFGAKMDELESDLRRSKETISELSAKNTGLAAQVDDLRAVRSAAIDYLTSHQRLKVALRS